VLLRLGRAREADVEFALALELDPLHALPRDQLAWRELLATSRGEPGGMPGREDAPRAQLVRAGPPEN
jgi:hypothetical protein